MGGGALKVYRHLNIGEFHGDKNVLFVLAPEQRRMKLNTVRGHNSCWN